MKIRILSDIHNETRRESGYYLPERMTGDDDTILVLAGDIGTGRHIGKYAKRLSKDFKHIVCVLGNHDYYDCDVMSHPIFEDDSFDEEYSNITVLQNRSVIIDGVRFVGGTLWTNYGNDPMAELMSQGYMPDYRRMTFFNEVPKPQDFVREFELTRWILRNELNKPFDGKTVVVTHHAPHEMSVTTRFKGHHLVNLAFYTDMTEELMMDVDLWIHGHMHEAKDYVVHGTRVVCNPLGYPGEYYLGFDPCKRIEL